MLRRNGTCEAKLNQIQAVDESIDDADERVRPNTVIDTRGKQIAPMNPVLELRDQSQVREVGG